MSRDCSWMLRDADDEQGCALRVDLHRTSSLDSKTSRLSATAAGGEVGENARGTVVPGTSLIRDNPDRMLTTRLFGPSSPRGEFQSTFL